MVEWCRNSSERIQIFVSGVRRVKVVRGRNMKEGAHCVGATDFPSFG